MKKTLNIFYCFIIIGGLSSCKKVSNNKLNGEWNVISGNSKITSVNSGGTTETTENFDGATISSTVKYTPASPTSVNLPTTTTSEVATTISFKFDKKTNKYTKTTVQKSKAERDIEAYSISNEERRLIHLHRKSEIKASIIEEGEFRITGGTGDVKKYSQIMLISSSVISTTEYTHSYFTEDGTSPADISDKYKRVISGLVTTYEPLASSLTESYTSTVTTEKNNQGVIWTVNELKNNSMDISYSTTQSTSVSGSAIGTTTNTEYVNYKLSEK